jgi:KAP family P-loop domain
LFGTIAEQIKTRFLIPGLSRELTRFARLLVGSVPKIGGFLESLLDEPSQVEQLRRLRKMLAGLPIRVVVLIDEVDRMDKVELNLLLKAVRGVVDLPNLTYVCAFSKDAVAKVLSPEAPQSGHAYLEVFRDSVFTAAH